jgi:putative tryptophan/tyrosine transport system substrate-binding protein
MHRRVFLATAGGVVLLSAVEGRSQQTSRRYHIAFLGLEPTPTLIEAFRQGLRELNYVEGENIAIEWRFSRDPARYAEFATEMIRLNVDVIVTGGAPTYAVQEATKTILIVFGG